MFMEKMGRLILGTRLKIKYRDLGIVDRNYFPACIAGGIIGINSLC